MKKTAVLLIALAFATLAHSHAPPAVAITAAKPVMNSEKFTAPAIETSGSDISLICAEMFYQVDSPKSLPALHGNSGNVILSAADAIISGDKPDDAWSTYCGMATIHYNSKAISYRFNSAPTYNFNSVRMNVRDYSMLGYNKKS